MRMKRGKKIIYANESRICVQSIHNYIILRIYIMCDIMYIRTNTAKTISNEVYHNLLYMKH